LPLALIALLNGPTESLLVLAGAVALQAFDGIVVQRRIDSSSVPLGMFPTLVAAMIGFSLRGPGGMLVGVAIAALLVSVLNDAGAMQVLRGAAPADDPDASAGARLSEDDAVPTTPAGTRST
jgi:predicted PurR-regulated permease PerM